MTRQARPDDVDVVCGGLPRTWFGTSWGDVPTWLVVAKARSAPREDKGRGFVLYRRPHHTAADPVTGEPYDDVLVVRTSGADAKQALVASGAPFFDVPHFARSTSVLLRLSRLDALTHDELVEVLTDAWVATAPPAVARELLG